MECSCGRNGINHWDCGGVLITATKFTKQDLLNALSDCAKYDDTEAAHSDADEYLLRFINDIEITKAFEKVKKFYA